MAGRVPARDRATRRNAEQISRRRRARLLECEIVRAGERYGSVERTGFDSNPTPATFPVGPSFRQRDFWIGRRNRRIERARPGSEFSFPDGKARSHATFFFACERGSAKSTRTLRTGTIDRRIRTQRFRRRIQFLLLVISASHVRWL